MPIAAKISRFKNIGTYKQNTDSDKMETSGKSP